MTTFNICTTKIHAILETETEPERWCFRERKRRSGKHELLDFGPGSYYDPEWRYVCDGCGGDYRLFPDGVW